jgi:DNA-binding transcriptional ArsR family regulator
MAEKNQAKELLDAALHPVRMRILMLLSGGEGLTPQQMAERMNDVPQATLYRHINRLAQSGMLVVAEERPVRGTLEKLYALNTDAEKVVGQGEALLEHFNQLSQAEHLRFFTTFVLTLVDDFARYLQSGAQEPPDLVADGVGYHKLALFLSDEELAQMSAGLNQALMPYLELKDAPNRKKRLLTTIMVPADEPVKPSMD